MPSFCIYGNFQKAEKIVVPKIKKRSQYILVAFYTAKYSRPINDWLVIVQYPEAGSQIQDYQLHPESSI